MLSGAKCLITGLTLHDCHIIEYSCKMLTEAHGIYLLHSCPASHTHNKLSEKNKEELFRVQGGIRITFPRQTQLSSRRNPTGRCYVNIHFSDAKVLSKVFLVGCSSWFHDYCTHLRKYIHCNIISIPAMKYFFTEVTHLFCYYLFICRLLIQIASLTAFGLPILNLSFENQ